MTASKTHRLAKTLSPTQTRLTKLRGLAQEDPAAAQAQAWAWIENLGARLPDLAADADLAELFAAGTPADVDGQTFGILVGWTKVDGLDGTGSVILPVVKAVLARIQMPWVGKKFDKANQRGTNTMTRTADILVRLLGRGYRLHKVDGCVDGCVDGHYEGFDMLNRVESSVVSPGTQVLVLDYEAAELGNPWPINRIRDEAVQLVPGVYLGAKIWHQADGYRQIAYWAAKASAGS